MRFQSIFAAEGEDGLTPIKTDKVKSGEISTFKASSDLKRKAKCYKLPKCLFIDLTVFVKRRKQGRKNTFKPIHDYRPVSVFMFSV